MSTRELANGSVLAQPNRLQVGHYTVHPEIDPDVVTALRRLEEDALLIDVEELFLWQLQVEALIWLYNLRVGLEKAGSGSPSRRNRALLTHIAQDNYSWIARGAEILARVEAVNIIIYN